MQKHDVPKPRCETCANWNEPQSKEFRFGICKLTSASTARDDICIRGWKDKETNAMCECGKVIGQPSFEHPDTGKTICVECALKVPAEKWKKDLTRAFLNDVKLCKEHRKTVAEPDLKGFYTMKCGSGSGFLCADKCPVPDRQTVNDLARKAGVTTLDARRYMEPNLEPEKEKKGWKSVQSFIDVQTRVLDKLAWHPEIYKLLDKLSSQEIIDRLGREVKHYDEEILPQHGGTMKTKPSDKTKQMFENLEKQFAQEDEKTGKQPYNFDEHPLDRLRWSDEDNGESIEMEDAHMEHEKRLAKSAKELDKDPNNVKICSEHRAKKNKLLFGDYRTVKCKWCVVFEDCPIYSTKKEEKKNGKEKHSA